MLLPTFDCWSIQATPSRFVVRPRHRPWVGKSVQRIAGMAQERISLWDTGVTVLASWFTTR